MELNINSLGQTTKTEQDGKKLTKTKSQNGRITEKSIFKDKNGNGKFEDNELTTIIRYRYEKDGSYERLEFKDENQDNKLDVVEQQMYDKDGNKLGYSRKIKGEDINCDCHSNMQNIKNDFYGYVMHLAPWEIK